MCVWWPWSCLCVGSSTWVPSPGQGGSGRPSALPPPIWVGSTADCSEEQESPLPGDLMGSLPTDFFFLTFLVLHPSLSKTFWELGCWGSDPSFGFEGSFSHLHSAVFIECLGVRYCAGHHVRCWCVRGAFTVRCGEGDKCQARMGCVPGKNRVSQGMGAAWTRGRGQPLGGVLSWAGPEEPSGRGRGSEQHRGRAGVHPLGQQSPKSRGVSAGA